MHGDMKECPHCGHDTYYTTFRVSGTGNHFVRFDGKDTSNSEMYDGIFHHTHKWARCADCEKRLFKVEE